jgi:FtsZ-binding cell division protein ZapB
MKTIEQLRLDIEELVKKNPTALPRESKKIQDKVRLIRQCIIYLESNPREDFLQDQLQKVSGRLKSIKAVCKTYSLKEAISQYKSLNDFDKLSAQQKTLDYILN